ncbi:MAG: hypothetical protein HY279_08165 [Nitrospinae bacterium]|nr:hypothetical protein [Nitrospinota bacterium]
MADDTKYKDKVLFSISELMEIFYGESIHVCPDEIEASLLARSALDDFLKSYPSYVFNPA